jgi:uncharacterized cupin superfamily protein
VPNVFDPDFDEPRGQPGFDCLRARVARQLGAEQLGLSLWEVPPGQAAYPYHWHVGEEELVVVLEGRPSLRTPEGWRELEEGEALSFLAGEAGGHQLVNRSQERVRFLSISTGGSPDVCVYPDSDKVGVYERPVGGGQLFRRSDAVDYWEGEAPPG